MPQAVVEVIKAGLDSQDSEVRFEAAELALSYPLRPPRRSRTIGPVASQRWLTPMDHNAARIAMGLEPLLLTE